MASCVLSCRYASILENGTRCCASWRKEEFFADTYMFRSPNVGCLPGIQVRCVTQGEGAEYRCSQYRQCSPLDAPVVGAFHRGFAAFPMGFT